jgi:hypothetical protein
MFFHMLWLLLYLSKKHVVTTTCSLQSELEIEPRYPLFGGWKASFVVRYGLPLQDFVFESPDGRRYLNFSFGCPLVETVVDKLTIEVGLVTWDCIYVAIVLFFAYIASRLMFKIWIINLQSYIAGCAARGIKRPFCCGSFSSGAASEGNLTYQFIHKTHWCRNSQQCQLLFSTTYICIWFYYIDHFVIWAMKINFVFKVPKF